MQKTINRTEQAGKSEAKDETVVPLFERIRDQHCRDCKESECSESIHAALSGTRFDASGHGWRHAKCTMNLDEVVREIA